jgi:hypothetical protein
MYVGWSTRLEQYAPYLSGEALYISGRWAGLLSRLWRVFCEPVHSWSHFFPPCRFAKPDMVCYGILTTNMENSMTNIDLSKLMVCSSLTWTRCWWRSLNFPRLIDELAIEVYYLACILSSSAGDAPHDTDSCCLTWFKSLLLQAKQERLFITKMTSFFAVSRSMRGLDIWPLFWWIPIPVFTHNSSLISHMSWSLFLDQINVVHEFHIHQNRRTWIFSPDTASAAHHGAPVFEMERSQESSNAVFLMTSHIRSESYMISAIWSIQVNSDKPWLMLIFDHDCKLTWWIFSAG